jgi:hypothetical protein
LKVSAGTMPAITTAWCAALNGDGSPIVTTSDGHSDRIVWVTGAEGDDRLHGFRAEDGAVVFDGGSAGDQMPRLRHLSTILAAEGRLYVPSDGRIFAFTTE